MSFLSLNAACLNKPRRLQRRVGIAGALVALSFGVLRAQEIPESAQQVILDVSQRLEWSDNPDLETVKEDRFTSRTRLQLGAFKRTRTDELSFSLGGDIELRNDQDNEITNSNLGLGWERDVRHARTGITFDFREVDLGTTTGTFFNNDTQSIDFGTFDSGNRQTSTLALSGAFGVDAPFGGNYDLSQRAIRYTDTIDPSLLDADRLTLDGDIYAVIHPRVTLGLDASYSDFDEVGPNDLDTTSSRIGTYLDLEISSRLNGRFELGWEEVEESGRNNNVEDGAVFDIALTRDLPRSELTFDLRSDIVASGRRGEFRVGQILDLPNNEFSYSLGLSRLEDFDTEPLFGLGWSQALPRGVITLDFEQRATAGRDNENLINTRMSFGYRQELTVRSGFDVQFSFIDSNDRSSSDLDTKRYDLDLTYRYALAQDWDLTSGISLVSLEEDGTSNRDASTVFVGLEKRFVWN
ncbi:MAG: hypothetical protein ABJN14_03635 [Paracoccaceae bacterium]